MSSKGTQVRHGRGSAYTACYVQLRPIYLCTFAQQPSSCSFFSSTAAQFAALLTLTLLACRDSQLPKCIVVKVYIAARHAAPLCRQNSRRSASASTLAPRNDEPDTFCTVGSATISIPAFALPFSAALERAIDLCVRRCSRPRL